VVAVVSTRVQLWREAELDRGAALAYRWRATTTRDRTRRRSWTEGVLLADLEEGVSRLGPEVAGFTDAAAVLSDVLRIAGRLPVMVDLRFDQPPPEPAGDRLRSWARRPRYDRPGLRGETLGERAARGRKEGDVDT
jgi:hypothetical protein